MKLVLIMCYVLWGGDTYCKPHTPGKIFRSEVQCSVAASYYAKGYAKVALEHPRVIAAFKKRHQCVNIARYSPKGR